MASSKDKTDVPPAFPATPAYKQWVWNEIRRRGWVLQTLVDKMKEADRLLSGGADTRTISTSTLIDLLGGEDDRRRFASNTKLMPAINKALGIAPPSICDPESPLGQIKDRLDALWRKMDAYQRTRFLRTMEGMLGLAEDSDRAIPR